jgi:uncharacterized protein YvpB
MRLHHKALLAVLALGNLTLLGATALAASGQPSLPLPALLLPVSLPTLVVDVPPDRVLPTPPVVRLPSADTPVLVLPTTTAASATGSAAQPPPPATEPAAAPPPESSAPLPEEAYVSGVIGHRQSLPLSCESRSAADFAAFFGVAVNELEFLGRLPTSDDPDRGFVGDVRGIWGQVPPNPYGVHAGPVARLLTEYGLAAQARRYMQWPALQAEIAAGRPAIVWVVGHVDPGASQVYTAADGRQTVVAAYEHTVILVGYTADTVTVLDGSNTRTYPLDRFLTSWDVLRNMAVTAGP